MTRQEVSTRAYEYNHDTYLHFLVISSYGRQNSRVTPLLLEAVCSACARRQPQPVQMTETALACADAL